MNEVDLQNQILKILDRTQTEFPELLKYMDEMPVIPSNEPGSIRPIKDGLAGYLDSLRAIFATYAGNHKVMGGKNIGRQLLRYSPDGPSKPPYLPAGIKRDTNPEQRG